MIIKPHVKLRRKIRRCNAIIKRRRAESKIYRNEASRCQETLDSIRQRFPGLE